MSWGVVFGGILLVVAHLISIKRLHIKFLIINMKNKQKYFKQTKFYKQFYPAVFGSSSAHIAAFLDTWLASFLVTGSISYLYYANRVFQLPLALFAIATSVALFPTIAKMIKNKNEPQALKYPQKAFFALLTLLGIAMIIGIVFNSFIVSLLFERGAGNAADDHPPGLRQRLTAPVLHRLAGFHGKLFRLLGMDRGDAGERAARDLVGRHVRLGYFRGERR